MHILDQRILGIAILFLLGTLVTAKQTATGSILDKAERKLFSSIRQYLQSLFLLVVNPLAAILLIVLGVILLTGEILHKQSENQSSFLVFGKSLGGLEYENLTATGRREGNRTKISG